MIFPVIFLGISAEMVPGVFGKSINNFKDISPQIPLEIHSKISLRTLLEHPALSASEVHP